MRAAQYVRMSTENQQFSIENQMAVIAEYAESHDFEVVQTYSDEARSGIDLARRPGLKQLLDDITNGKPDFRAVLVYDVSRWGRFQDTDESACYEFLCRRAGVNVVYCAERFENDESVASALLKSLRRVMAGEYLRDLSARVFAGQCRIARKGFKLGGSAGYGLRRLLLNADGTPQRILASGERKYLTTDRVTYVMGPAWEVRTVRKIYSLFLDEDLSCAAIVRRLNQYRIPREEPKLWKDLVVHRILSHPKYIGSIVFNQTSGRLRSKIKRNPREQWVVEPNRFPAIISLSRFEQAQSKLGDRVHLRSDERLLQELREFIAKHGRATQHLIGKHKTIASHATYAHRFGSLHRAVEMINTEPLHGFPTVQLRLRLKLQLQDEFTRALARTRIPSQKNCGIYTSSAHGPVLLEVARCYSLLGRDKRWEIRYSRKGGEGMSCIAGRLDPENRAIVDYLFIPRLPKAVQRVRLSELHIRSLGIITPTLGQAIELLLSEHKSPSDGNAAPTQLDL